MHLPVQEGHDTRTTLVSARVLYVLVEFLFLFVSGTLCDKEQMGFMNETKSGGIDSMVARTLLVLASNLGLSGAEGLCSWPRVLVAEPWLYLWNVQR